MLPDGGPPGLGRGKGAAGPRLGPVAQRAHSERTQQQRIVPCRRGGLQKALATGVFGSWGHLAEQARGRCAHLRMWWHQGHDLASTPSYPIHLLD